MALQKIKSQTNTPVEKPLKFPEGKLCDSQFGDPQEYVAELTEDTSLVAGAFGLAATAASCKTALVYPPGGAKMMQQTMTRPHYGVNPIDPAAPRGSAAAHRQEA